MWRIFVDISSTVFCSLGSVEKVIFGYEIVVEIWKSLEIWWNLMKISRNITICLNVNQNHFEFGKDSSFSLWKFHSHI